MFEVVPSFLASKKPHLYVVTLFFFKGDSIHRARVEKKSKSHIYSFTATHLAFNGENGTSYHSCRDQGSVNPDVGVPCRCFLG